MKYTTLLFDLDETLMDFKKAEDNAISLFFRKYGIDPTAENKSLYSEINKSKWKALERGEITRSQLFLSRFEELFNIFGIVADAAAANDEYLSFMAESRFVFEGTEEICRELSKNYKLYIITNGSKKAQDGRLKNLPLIESFEDVFISEEIGFDKPYKEFFDYVFEHIPEKDKSKCLVIGDSLTSDIAGAVNYGIDSCWLNPGEYRESPATYQIKKLDELLGILNT